MARKQDLRPLTLSSDGSKREDESDWFILLLPIVRRFLAAAAVIGASVISTIQPAASQPLVGNYQCTGKNSNGGVYTGEINISKRGEGYFLTWTIAGITHSGVGIKRGNVLASSWSPSPNMHGVVAYEIESRGQLKGLWSKYPDARTINPEDCKLID